MKRIISTILAAVLLISCLSLISCSSSSANTQMTDYVYVKTVGETIVGFLSDSTTPDADKKLAEDIFKRLGDGAETTITVNEYNLSETDVKDALTSKKIDLVISVAASAADIEGVEKSSVYTVGGAEYVILLRKGSDLTEKINNYIENHKSDIASIYGETE